MNEKLITRDGMTVCASCHIWNCWHSRGEPCDIRGCECTLGQVEVKHVLREDG